MSPRANMLSAFTPQGGTPPLYVPDLTLWYNWHQSKGTLPEPWTSYSLPQIAQALDVPIWLVTSPWRLETPGIDISTTEDTTAKIVRYETPAGSLSARWAVGPDRDWWQTEHLVKTPQDLGAALALVQARSYVLDAHQLAPLEDEVGDAGVLAIQIPRRPYSDLLHDFLGWGEGLFLLGEPAVPEILATLEAKLHRLVQEVARLPGQVIFSRDNLDGQFISPRAFGQHLAASYRGTADLLHEHGKRLLVHVGGPIRHLLAPLAQAGVDGIEGVAGPPQGDVSLSEARETASPHLTLWGGIPQDWLLPTHDRRAFEKAVTQAAHEAADDGRMILGVADKVPIDAELDRLRDIPSLVAQQSVR